jgi:hypothetical protein
MGHDPQRLVFFEIFAKRYTFRNRATVPSNSKPGGIHYQPGCHLLQVIHAASGLSLCCGTFLRLNASHSYLLHQKHGGATSR